MKSTKYNNWNANQLTNDTVEFHVSWQRFKNAQGNWQPISRLITDAGGDFVMNNAPFSCTFPRWSHAIATMTATCRYDIWKKEDITADPYTMTIRARETAEVKGKLFDMNGTGVFDAVIYEGAYPQWNADLIYYVHHGRAPRLQKLIRYNSHPLVAHRPKFFIDTSHDTELSSRNIPNGMTRRQHRDTCKGVLDSLDGELQPLPLEADGGFYCRKDGEAQKRGIGIKEVKLWDSGEGESQKIRIIPSNMRRREGHYTFIKRVPSAWFDDAVFPCFTDGEFTFYPDPHPETTTVDGYAYKNGSANWNTVHDATTGTGSGDNLADSGGPGSLEGAASDFRIDRSFQLYDTSSLGVVTIISATESLYARNIVNSDNDGDDWVVAVQSSPASNTAIGVADYNQCGAVNNPTEGSARVDIGDITLNQYFDLVYNATGIGWINKTGITKSGTREGHDAIDSPVVGSGAFTGNSVALKNAEEAGTDKDPKLVIIIADVLVAERAIGAFGIGRLGLRS
ncbi:hypothetical protein KAR91_42055 [Candidatus Pacearchaeota archaeon]|nr:hypothetical protein [Candidatus Pacearchaeota archaeon]